MVSAMSEKVFLSGIQTTGEGQPTLGNYLGALKRYVDLQNEGDSYFFLANSHALTVRIDPAQLRHNTLSMAAWYLAAGLNPKTATLFVQSQVTEHAQLAWVLNTFSQMGELERMTEYKDKASRNKGNINAGLFTYPVLQAADILLYQPTHVPVGEDQKQHLELCRNIAIRFNNLFDQSTFTVPEPFIPTTAARVKDLQDPTSKMSKSLAGQGCVFLDDEDKVIEKKFKRAVTDNEAQVRIDEQNQPGITNLLEILATISGKSMEQAQADCADMQYGTFKQAVADAVVAKIAPIRTKHAELITNTDELETILADGAARARTVAAKTLANVYDTVGLLKA